MACTAATSVRVVDQISRHLIQPSASFFFRSRRGVHATVYDKNPEDLVQHSEVIRDPQSDKYWAPHPKTGVFGPAAAHNKFNIFPTNIGKDSVLELKVWFRPTSLEDVEKPV